MNMLRIAWIILGNIVFLPFALWSVLTSDLPADEPREPSDA